MVNQRQSSDRGCTQRGAYRRDFVFKVSQVILAFALAMVSSATVFAAGSVTGNTLVLTLTSPSPAVNFCSDANGASSGVAMQFTLSGEIVTSSASPEVQVFIQPLNAGSTTCKAQPSGMNGTVPHFRIDPAGVSSPYTAPTGGLTFTAQPLTFSTVCNQTAIAYAVCVYAVDKNSANSDYLLSSTDSPKIIKSRGGGTTTPTDSTLSISSALAGDQKITFTVSGSGSFESFELCYSDADPIPSDFDSTSTCSGNSTVIGGYVNNGSAVLIWNEDAAGGKLVNGTLYRFKVRGVGTTTNPWSNVAFARPTMGYSTLALYQGTNGGLSWQCGQSSNSPLSLITILGMFAFVFLLSKSRRQKIANCFAHLSLFVVAVAFTLPAAANLNLGLTGGPYKPHLDRDKGLKVYECLYGDATLPMLGASFDFHVYDPYGSFQLGLGLGYSWASGTAGANQPVGDAACGVVGSLPGASVAFHTLQLRPRFTYVFDPFVDTVPFVPYVRAGLVGAGYYFTYQGSADTGGQDNGNNPAGVKFGWEAGGGLMFLLDSLEPMVASRARAGGVYNRTYLVADVAYSSINDFGAEGYDFSPQGIFGSTIPLLFTFSLVLELQ